MTAPGGSSRLTLELLGGLQVREKDFGLPPFLPQGTTTLRPGRFSPTSFFSISSTSCGVVLARKKRGKGLCRGANV